LTLLGEQQDEASFLSHKKGDSHRFLKPEKGDSPRAAACGAPTADYCIKIGEDGWSGP